jgi:leader peptidase (prepilin peptidase)/N-methyltransferase
LGVGDLVPLMSWLALKGRCRYCDHVIGVRYPVMELATGLAFLIAWLTAGFGPAFPMLAALSVILVVLATVDIEHGYLPDPLQVAAAVLAPGWWMTQADLPAAAISGIGAGILLAALGLLLRWAVQRIRRREGLGLGDVKLMAVAGLWLGLAPIPLFLVLTGFVGVILAFFWRATGRGPEFPLGPAIATALFLCLVLPAPVG